MIAMYGLLFLSATVRQFFDPAWESVLPEIASEEELSRGQLVPVDQLVRLDRGRLRRWPASSPRSTSTCRSTSTRRRSSLSFVLVLLVRIPKMPRRRSRPTIGVVVENLKSGAQLPVADADPALARSSLDRPGPAGLRPLERAAPADGDPASSAATEFEYGLQEGVTSVGFVVGSLLMARYGDRLAEGTWMVAGIIADGRVRRPVRPRAEHPGRDRPGHGHRLPELADRRSPGACCSRRTSRARCAAGCSRRSSSSATSCFLIGMAGAGARRHLSRSGT